MSETKENHALIFKLADTWLEAEDQQKPSAMSLVVKELKRMFEETSFEDDSAQKMHSFDKIIRKLARKFTIQEGEVEDREDVRTRHEIEEVLWLQLNTQQLEIIRKCGMEQRQKRIREELRLSEKMPLEDRFANIDVDDGEDIGSDDDEEEEEEEDNEDNEGDSENESDHE